MKKKKTAKAKTNLKLPKYLLYQTRVIDGIIMILSEQKPELH